jgi:Helicase conserved C-terminal domain
VLCATDIAARGIHVDDVSLVVHVDPPAEHKAYLHRSGRTARAGAGGTVVTVVTPDQNAEVRTLARQAGISPVVTPVTPGAALLEELAGPAAPYVEPAPAPAPQQQGTGGGRRRRAGTGGGAPSGRANGGTSAGGSSSRGSSSRGSSGGSSAGRNPGPARTRAELAARAGTSSAASFSARSRRGR